MEVRIDRDPDFKPDAKRTIDIRPFFGEPEKEDDGEEGASYGRPAAPAPDMVVSPAYAEENRRRTNLEEERARRERDKPIRKEFEEWFLEFAKSALVFLIMAYQAYERRVRPFETKYEEKQLYYLAISLPNTVRNADDVLLYFPLMSRSIRYKVLKMRKDTLATYRKIYEKRQ